MLSLDELGDIADLSRAQARVHSAYHRGAAATTKPGDSHTPRRRAPLLVVLPASFAAGLTAGALLLGRPADRPAGFLPQVDPGRTTCINAGCPADERQR